MRYRELSKRFPRIQVNAKKYTRAIGEREITVELNQWAEQASGSVLVRMGDTVILATAVMSKEAKEGGDYFPLMVEYEEKFYATGKILGSRFVKRETRPSEEAVLAGRFIDRSIRPRFNSRMRNDVQVIVTVLSIDDQNDPDILGLLGASLALSLSDIPWEGPVAGVRLALKDGAKIINPTNEERETADLEAIVSGTADKINMLEAGTNKEISEDDFSSAVEIGQKHLKELVEFQKEIIAENKPDKSKVRLVETPAELEEFIRQNFSEKIEGAVYNKNKQNMKSATATVMEEWLAAAETKFPETFQKSPAQMLFDEEINKIVHRRVIEKGERPDGRGPEDIRELKAEIGVLPRVHGSAIFMRGQTHALATLTLGSPGDEQIVEGMEIRTKKRFLLHYNFPPFSVGEVKPMRGPGRRDIGHGALAGKAIWPLLPGKEEFPYTIRIVSEILSSNGSSSMATVCGASLALMDAGVSVKKLAAGAAMGLMMNEKGDYKVLTDIQGPEDHHGDMDFKVAGTRDGITAVQMDVKIEGITLQMVKDTLKQALDARLKILDFMETIIKEPRPELSPWAPRIQVLKINPEKIGALIGPGGKVINDIIDKTGAAIDIDDDGIVFITSEKEEGMKLALEMVKQITKEIKPGEILEGKVSRLFEFGAMVEIGPRLEGLIHISELAPWRVEKVTDIVNTGDKLQVLVKNIDEQGRINLSLKDVPGRYSEEEIRNGRERNPGGNNRRDFNLPRNGKNHRPSRR